MKRLLTSLRVLSPVFLAVSLVAQTSTSPAPQDPQNQFRFESYVNRLVLDVVVSDSQYRPIRGLTEKDFAVYEDGKRQQILSFDVHSLNSPPGYFRKLPPLPPNTFVNIATEPEKGPLYVLLLDLLHIVPEHQPYARQQLLKFIEGKPEGTRFAVFALSDSLHLVQGFTSDRAQLYSILDPRHPRPHIPRIFLFAANYYDYDPLIVLSTFREIALYLDGLPGRKNIIWYSDAFPLDLFPRLGDSRDQRADTAEMLDALTRGECSIYPVSASGLIAFPPNRLTGITPGAGPSGASVGGPQSVNIVPGGSQNLVTPPGAWATGTIPRGGPGGGPLLAQMTAIGVGGLPWDSDLDEIADFTGGRAYYSRNDLKDILEDATEDGGNYYTLTYSPSNRNYDGKLRSIAVRLAIQGKKYHMEYRRGYMATAPESAILPVRAKPRKNEDPTGLRPTGDTLAAYMQHGAPIAREVYFQAHVHAISPSQLATPEQMANLIESPTYFRVRQRKHPNKPLAPTKLQTYLIEYQILAQHPNLEVAAGAYDVEGRLLNGDVEETSSAAPGLVNPEAKNTFFRVQQKIDVPADSAFVRLGVRDAVTNRMGTIEISLPLAPEP